MRVSFVGKEDRDLCFYIPAKMIRVLELEEKSISALELEFWVFRLQK